MNEGVCLFSSAVAPTGVVNISDLCLLSREAGCCLRGLCCPQQTLVSIHLSVDDSHDSSINQE